MKGAGSIVAAVGDFPQDDAVLARAADIARAHRATLTVVHVIDDGGGGLDALSADLDPLLIQRELQRLAREALEAAMARQDLAAAEVVVRIESGAPAGRLCDLLDEIEPDLIVMRAHQRESVLEKIIGSTTDRVIRAGRAPVLVVKRPVTQTYARIVVGVETSEDACTLLSCVAALFPAAALHLVHVVQVPVQFEAAMLHAGFGRKVASYRQRLAQQAQQQLSELSASLPDRPLPSSTRVIIGAPARSLLRATWSPQVGLIALGPGEGGNIRRALLGSVARRVLEGAACDVLICRSVADGERQ